MADVKITDLANLAAPDGADLVEAVDVSDTSSAATGTNKKLTLSNFQVWLGGFSYTPSAHAASHEGGADAISPAGIGAATAAQGTLADTAVQPDATNTFTVSPQTIQSPTVGGGLDILAQQTPRIRFLSENGVADNKDQRITQTNLGYLRFAAHNDLGANVAEMLRVYNQGGVTVGDPTGGDQGLGAINAQNGVFDNGNRVYSAGNPPPPGGGGGTGEAVVWSVTQAGHPFNQIGQPIYTADGTTWAAAQADNAATIHTAVVAENTDANTFKAQQSGILTGITFATLTPGSFYYLADNGSLSTTPGTFDAPVLLALTATSALILPYRAGQVGAGVGSDILLDGYREQGNNTGLPTSGTITVPMDGRVYEVTLTGAATLAFGAKPAAPITASTVIMIKSAGNTLAFPASTYWLNRTPTAVGGAGTISRYVMSLSPTGDQIMDGEVLSV